MNVFRFNSGDLLLPNSGSFPSFKKTIAVKYVSSSLKLYQVSRLVGCVSLVKSSSHLGKMNLD